MEDSASSLVVDTNTRRCKGITQKGTPCKNVPMKGFDFCWQHQLTCAHRGPNSESCGNFVVAGSELCPFHSPAEPDQEGLPTHQTSLLDFAQQSAISRREFLQFLWPLKFAEQAAKSISSLPRPIKVVGGVIGVGVAQYLIEDFLDYFKHTHDIEYLVPLTYEDEPESGQASECLIDDESTGLRIINSEEYGPVALEVEYVDYRNGRRFRSTGIKLDPNHSYVDTTLQDSSLRDFRGGAQIRSTGISEVRHLVRLKIVDTILDPLNAQFVDFRIPVSQRIPVNIHNVIAMIVLGKKGTLQQVEDIHCVVKKDRVYFDRGAVLDLIDKSGATDAMFVIQLEGRFVASEAIHQLASGYLSGYRPEEAELRFETTAEMLGVRTWKP